MGGYSALVMVGMGRGSWVDGGAEGQGEITSSAASLTDGVLAD